MDKICEKLKELREENNLTQTDVAKILNISRPTYTLYENNKRSIPHETLLILANYYNVSLDYIYGRED